MPHFDFSLPLKDPVLIFFVVLFIILLAPILLARFKLPSLIGLILAGLAAGPHGFGVLSRDSSIVLFGTVGLLYIMFLAALELDLNEFRKNKYRSLLFGALTFLFPFGLGILACRWILGFDLTASILVASMFSTHTLVAYPAASRLGITKNQAVTITVGGTVITDTLVLLILAVITGSRTGGLGYDYWIRLSVSLVAFCLVTFVLFPMLARWFFRNLEDEKTSQFLFVLALIFAAAFLAKLAGMEPIIGAFAAGLALNTLIPHTSPLMNRIEFVGNALFIPFFLIDVGMLVDTHVLFSGPEALMTAAVLTTVALTGKWLAAFATQKAFGYSRAQRGVIFGLSSSHAAATLAVILVGFNLGIVGEGVLNGTIVLILVSCLLGSFVTERAGRQLAIVESAKKPEPEVVSQKILVPIANPETIERLLDLSIMIRDPAAGQPISMLTVVRDDDEAAVRVAEGKKMFEKAVQHGSATDIRVKAIARVDLNVASGIVRTAKELGVTDIVLGWSGRSRAADRIFGSTMDSMLENASQSILVCNLIEPLNTAKRIVAAVPPNAEFERGFERWVGDLKRLARQTGTKVVFFLDPSSGAALKKAMEGGGAAVEADYRDFNDWEDFLILCREVGRDDLFVVVSARDGGISYLRELDDVPRRLFKHFGKNSFIVIYPEQNPASSLTGEFS